MSYFTIGLTFLVAVFTGLYWWDARRAFFLELDRVVLWFRLEEDKQREITKSKFLNETIKWAEHLSLSSSKRKEIVRYTQKHFEREELIEGLTGPMAFFQTLKSKTLRNRLDRYEKKQKELASSFRDSIEKSNKRKKDLTNGKTKRRKE